MENCFGLVTSPYIFIIWLLSKESKTWFFGCNLVSFLKLIFNLKYFMRRFIHQWVTYGFDKSTFLQCLYEVGKYRKITLLDICCEMLEPEPQNFIRSDHTLTKDNLNSMHDQHSRGCLQTVGYAVWASQILRYCFLLVLSWKRCHIFSTSIQIKHIFHPVYKISSHQTPKQIDPFSLLPFT